MQIIKEIHDQFSSCSFYGSGCSFKPISRRLQIKPYQPLIISNPSAGEAGFGFLPITLVAHNETNPLKRGKLFPEGLSCQPLIGLRTGRLVYYDEKYEYSFINS